MWHRFRRVHGVDAHADVEDEFAFHLEQRIEALVARGLSERDARAEALLRFGDLAAAAAECTAIGDRRARRVRLRERLESVVQDIAYAVRAMRRAPAFTVAAVMTIALGIGANTAVFSLLNVLLLQPLDAERPAELVRIYTSEGHAPRDERDLLGGSSYADYVDLRRAGALADLASYLPLSASVRIGADDGMRYEARAVSANLFALLGRQPLRGGWRDDGEAAVIVSHGFWLSALGGDERAIGRSIVVNGKSMRVAGVLAPSFRWIEPAHVDLYVPFAAAPALTGRSSLLTDRGERSVRLLGRLAPGTSAAAAQRSLDAIMSGLAAEFPATNARRTISVRPAQSVVPLELAGRAVLPVAGLVFGATLVMLALAGVNSAAVLLARTFRRRRELAVRLSLGAGRLRVIRLLLTESVVLAFAAGVVVVALLSLLPLLARTLGVPQSVHPVIDVRVLGYAAAVALGFGLLLGIAPALAGTRGDMVESLRRGEAGARPGRARAQQALVGAQLALSMLLLTVAGGLLASLARLQRIEPGFTIDNVIVAQFEDPLGANSLERDRVFTRLVAERLGALPSVASVSVGSMAPLTSDGVVSTIRIPGYEPQPDEIMDVRRVTAGPDFFRTLGIPLRRGRELTWADRDTLRHIVINESMARRYWGDRDPIGTFVELADAGGTRAQVIGVAADARFIALGRPPEPMYVVQRTTDGGGTVLVRARGDAGALLLAVRGSMSRNDVPLTLTQLRTMSDVVQSSLAVTRAVSAALLAIGLLAVLLAAVGLYGVVSYVTAGRAREFGVRLALGATPSSLTRLVLGYGARIAAIGAGIGLLLGLGALRLIGSLLFGSWISLPMTATAASVLCAVALLASAVPALRATASSPATALRTD